VIGDALEEEPVLCAPSMVRLAAMVVITIAIMFHLKH